MTKRQKFVFTSLSLALLMFGVKLSNFEFSNFLFPYEVIVPLSAISALLTFWSLRESLRLDATLLSLSLPVFFTLGSGFFYLYLVRPGSFFESVPLVPVAYAVGMYAALLGANIYAVASLRTIALLRTAHAVGFLLTLVTAFFLFDALLSFNSYPWVNAFSALVISFPLILQNIWSIELTERVTANSLNFSAVLSLVIAELALMISFWPVTVTIGSLFLTIILYVFLGLTQASLQGRLFQRTIREYVTVGVIVFIAVFLSARWGG